MTMTKRLRDAINDCPLPFQALERETGVTRQALMRFSRSESSIRLDMADKLAAYFRLHLTDFEDSDNG